MAAPSSQFGERNMTHELWLWHNLPSGSSSSCCHSDSYVHMFMLTCALCTFTWRRPLLNSGSETWLKLCLTDHLLLAVLIVAFSYLHMVIVFIHMWIRGWNMTQYLPCGSSSSWCHSDLHMFTCSMFIVYIHVPVRAWQWPLPSSGSEIWICLYLVDHLLLAYILMDYSGSRPPAS